MQKSSWKYSYNPSLFTSALNTPSWERVEGTQYLEVTHGCAHNSCRFCTYYKRTPFKPSTDKEIERSLKYLSLVDAKTPIKRIFLQGADPFVLSYDRLMEIREKLFSTLPNLESIGGYGRMTDICNKSVDQLKSLHEAGFTDFFFGVESADDALLKFVNKGYDADTLWEQGMKMHESGMPWRAVIMLGLGGHGWGESHPLKTAEFFSATQPSVIGIVSLTLIYDQYTHMFPPLYEDMRNGTFVEAGELERYEELKCFIEHLDCETVVAGQHSTMPYWIAGRMPRDKEKVLEKIDWVLENGDEQHMRSFRDMGVQDT